MKSSERFGLVVLLVVAGVCGYFLFFLKPMRERMTDLDLQTVKTREKARQVAAQFPETSGRKAEVEEVRKRLSALDKEIQGVESNLLGRSQLTPFLAQLMDCAQGVSLDVDSVKQEIEEDKSGFSHLRIDMKVTATFEHLLEYVHRVERISPFVRLETIGISQGKGDNPGETVVAELRLVAILASGPTTATPLKFACSTDPLDFRVTRAPFAPAIKIASIKKRTLKLLGITFRGEGPESSAIINDNVVKVGDEVEGQKVEKILADAVILTDGQESYSLTVDR